MTSPSEKHMEEANEICSRISEFGEPAQDVIANALANAEREGMRRAAEIAQRTAKYHLDASGMNLPVEPSPIIAKDRARIASGISDAILSEIGDKP